MLLKNHSDRAFHLGKRDGFRGHLPKSDYVAFDLFAVFGHIVGVEKKFYLRTYDPLSLAAPENLAIMSNLVLFSSGAPDFLVAGIAVLAMLCGIALMGGRWVVGVVSRMLSSLRGRRLRREAVVCARIPLADGLHEQDAGGVQRPLRRAA